MKLRSCPFCVSHDSVEAVSLGKQNWAVGCAHCGAIGPSDSITGRQSKKVAVARWNTRILRFAELPDAVQRMIPSSPPKQVMDPVIYAKLGIPYKA